MAMNENDANRFQTMSLTNRNPLTLETPKRTFSGHDFLSTADIEGAQPKKFANAFLNKPDLYNPTDIHGSSPEPLYKFVNRPQLANRTDDIEGAQPCSHEFHPKLIRDPLDPVYDFPTNGLVPPPPPRFLGDRMDASDISGRHIPLSKKWKPMDHISVDDIEGAKPRVSIPQEPPKGCEDYSLKSSDINGTKFTPKLDINPLNPTYRIHGEIIDDSDPKFRPKALHPELKGVTTFSLKTDDIEGCKSGWVPPHSVIGVMSNSKQTRNPVDISDVEGAHPPSFRDKYHTFRMTDPLMPRYVYLDGTVEAEPQVKPFVLKRPPKPRDNNTTQQDLDPKDAEIERLRKQVEELKLKTFSAPKSEAHKESTEPGKTTSPIRSTPLEVDIAPTVVDHAVASKPHSTMQSTGSSVVNSGMSTPIRSPPSSRTGVLRVPTPSRSGLDSARSMSSSKSSFSGCSVSSKRSTLYVSSYKSGKSSSMSGIEPASMKRAEKELKQDIADVACLPDIPK